MTWAILFGMPEAGNLHVRFDEGKDASYPPTVGRPEGGATRGAKPRPVSLRYSKADGLKVALVVAFSAVGVLAGRAETLTWTGKGGDNKISTAANWIPVKTPAMGDRLVSDVADLHFAAETIELTGEGLVFAPTARTYFDNTFTGSGKLTIDGSNVVLIFDTKNLSYAGETIVYHGELKPNTSHVFGTGPVSFHQDSKTDPCINNSLSKIYTFRTTLTCTVTTRSDPGWRSKIRCG